MSFYAERNGLASSWERDHNRFELARWVYHHPDFATDFIENCVQRGINIFDTEPTDDNPTYNISILISALDALADPENLNS